MRPVETPYYTYELAEVRRAHRRLRAALPEGSPLFYSLKANAHPAVLGELARAGCRAEVSSPGELVSALAAGFAPAEVVYTGPGKREEDVRFAVDRGVRLFSVDSPTALDQLDRVGSTSRTRLDAVLRVNQPDPPRGVGLAMTGGASKFGVDLGWVVSDPDAFADRARVTVVGAHLYMGSNLGTEEALLGVFEHAVAAAGAVRAALGRDLAFLDLGGGFGAPYAQPGPLPDLGTLRERLGDLFDRTVPGWRAGAPRIAFESGRYLATACGTLVCTVLDVKRSGGRRIAVLDSGVHHLGGMSGLGHEEVIGPRVLTDAPGAPTPGWTLAGPLCHPLDTWGSDLVLPELRVGDRISVPNVGAYALSASLVLFHGHAMPWEVVLDEGTEVDRSRLTPVRERP
ncbi:type III PLP-dependent enzyme [Saccharothrix lopnurensis]|uniref:Type III PLP-dependent enzyme n=1 Tax=Saccharothrix lopnurensis TaxID=1670621 RepID=A0ABW1PE33_9PSEU